MNPVARPRTESDEFRILDGRGCVTPEALCFIGELVLDQRAAVERHTRSCTICAQQHASLARATARFRRARPRVPVPTEVKVLARQAALRKLTAQRPAPAGSTTARLRVRRGRAVPWHRSRAFWVALLAGMATALVLAVLALFLI